MSDNLIFLINKLSYVIVSQGIGDDNTEHSAKKDEYNFNKCLKKIRQTGCDILLKKISGTAVEDPCLTDYGGNWSPVALITDYGRELQALGAGKYNDFLLSCLKILDEKQCDCVNDILKFLLILKQPLVKESSSFFQKELSFNGSDSLLHSIDSESFMLEDYPLDGLSRTSSHKKALQYEESWTKHFDVKFQLLGEYSKKNLFFPDKVSLNSLFPSRPMVNTSQSRSNSFVFPDFSSARNYRSEKSLFDINSGTYLIDNPFLDNFVDQPISHKLPALSLNPKFSSKNGFLERSSLQIKNNFPSFPEEGHPNESSQMFCNLSTKKPSVIELKRNSNCSHSFAILYEKSAKSRISSSCSNESISWFRSGRRNKSAPGLYPSQNIVLALWEQEQNLIREFKPELATDFPELRMITLMEYVEDVKYLFTGINSGTFRYDAEKNSFSMVYGTCLDDVTPESLLDFSKDFLEIGNYYVKLNTSVTEIGKNNFDTCTTTTQAFWKSIFDFLELHYSLVLDIPFSVNLMALKSCTRDLHDIITTVANICKVLEPGEALPKGGELLSYLLEFAERVTKQSVINVVFGILQNCCSAYFMCELQNWMFKGRLGVQQKDEFFVDCHHQKVKTKSRAYYNSFYTIDDKIPKFLRGCEESIYNCGKSIHFLKLFNPKDKFCQLLEKGDYPNMIVCFSDEQLAKLEGEFKSYEERVIKSCGERVTIRTIREEEKERERAYVEYIKECRMLEEEKRELARRKQLEEAKAVRDRQNQLLNEQLCTIEAEKQRKRQEEEMERVRLEEEIKKVEMQRENLVRREKLVLKECYDELIGNLEKEQKVQEKRKENLQKIIAGELDLDIINDNLSKEGNITNELDINCNSSEVPSVKFIKSTETKPETEADIAYDENSNPSPANEASVKVETMKKTKPDSFIRKIVSHRTVAAEEAVRNKCKILRSEFGLPVRRTSATPAGEIPPKSDAKSNVTLTDREKNRLKVLESEYNLLKPPNQHFSLRNVSHKVQITKEEVLEPHSVISSSSSLKFLDFNSVGLERKSERLNLEGTLHPKPAANDTPCSDSSDSFHTPSNGLSAENIPNEDAENIPNENAENIPNENAENIPNENAENIPNEDGGSIRTLNSSSIFLNEKYQDALALDLNVFYHKISHRHIFCHLNEEEVDSIPCTDFTMFQRYLRKSALIPLKVQEKLANDALLKHLLKGENLLSHLNSLRGYFFLNDGEFGRSFTHHTFRSLARCTEPEQFFERNNLGSIVSEALNYTIHNSEPNSENLSFRIVKMPPFLNHSSHNVLSAFELSYKVEWPLNIILTEKALGKYKLVFRFLLKLKRINWTLNENFLYLNSHFKNKRLKEENLTKSPHYHKIQIYRHAMTQVMVTLDDYIFSNGVQFPWIYFLKDLETTENIDHLYQKHVRYIKDVLRRCFLSKNSEDLLECIHNMIELALKFHYTAKSSMMEVVRGRYEHPKFSVLKMTFNEFCSVIKVFLRTLKEKISSNQVLKSHYVLIEKFDMKLT